jgi:DNA (cytosine-5)-methyltransferase 1
MMRVLDLFSGIGAFSLGLERTGGFQTTAFVEIDPFCRRVLAKHWPEVPQYDDVRSLTAERLRADGISVDVICGGFPCQDISTAGRGAGLAGERSGLWSEFARLIGEVRPRYVIVENVAALLGRGLGTVLGDLAALRYDAEWHCIPAAAVGAPHIRDRVWIVAYAAGAGRADWHGEPGGRFAPARGLEPVGLGCEMADANYRPLVRPPIPRPECNPWEIEPRVGRVVDGAASRVDRRKRLIGLGNSLVPQIPELIGRAILAVEASAAELAV